MTLPIETSHREGWGEQPQPDVDVEISAFLDFEQYREDGSTTVNAQSSIDHDVTINRNDVTKSDNLTDVFNALPRKTEKKSATIRYILVVFTLVCLFHQILRALTR